MTSTLNTLLCRADLDMAITTLRRFRQSSYETVNFRVFEDGSLTADDIARLRTEVADCEILRDEDIEARVLDALRPYRRLHRYRAAYQRRYKIFVYSKKLLDIPLLGGDQVWYADVDVLPLKRIAGLLGSDSGHVITAARQNAYSCDLRFLHRKMEGRLLDGFNAGLFCLDKRGYDLDFIEWLLGFEELYRDLFMLEQTAFACLFSRDADRAKVIAPWQYACNSRGARITANTLLVHFTGARKETYRSWLRISETELSSGRVRRLQLVEPKLLGHRKIRFVEAWRQVRRRLRKKGDYRLFVPRHWRKIARSLVHPSVVTLGMVRICVAMPVVTPTVRRAIYASTYEAAEAKVLANTLAPGDRVLELGAGLGYLACVSAMTAASVAVVEANETLLPAIRRNAEINGARMAIEVGAVGPGRSDSCVFFRTADFWTSSLRAVESATRIRVRRLSLETLLAKHRPSYLIVDIEGIEVELLADASLEGVDKILVEVHPHVIGVFGAHDLVRELDRKDFALESWDSEANVQFYRRRPATSTSRQEIAGARK